MPEPHVYVSGLFRFRVPATASGNDLLHHLGKRLEAFDADPDAGERVTVTLERRPDCRRLFASELREAAEEYDA